MINSTTEEYYRNYCGAHLAKYIQNAQDTRFNYILMFIIICILLATIALAQPLFASVNNKTGGETVVYSPPPNNSIIINRKIFEQNIKAKYRTNQIVFPAAGIAHIKKVKYINSKPVRINIAEINTNVNPNLKIQPQIASNKLNAKSTVRKIAQKSGSIVAINGGFFKPQTGVPLGALMIDGKVLTGSIYNRVGIAIFEENNTTSFKMANIEFEINALTKNNKVKIDNINQPRMLQSYLLLYTSDWGKIIPAPPKTGWNMIIRDKKVIKITANPTEIEENDMVLQGNKDILSKLAQDKEIDIDIQLQDGLKGAQHIISAGPYLVKDSKIYVDTQTQRLQAISGKNPRSAIGYKNDGTLIIVTVDGREEASVGMTLRELAVLMKNLGCDYAMNFDGGSSSAMYINGHIANRAVNKEGIAISNALTVTEINSQETRLAGI